jgi:N utilization substance protein B
MSVSLRREGREAAIQFLFGADLNKLASVPAEERTLALRDFWALREKPPRERTQVFAADLVQGVLANLEQLDEIISKYVLNYELSRIAVVDRNVLRLAVFEMLHREDIPPVVSLNEAIEIARKFGSEHSDQFVNGILDKVVKQEVQRPLRTARDGSPAKK